MRCFRAVTTIGVRDPSVDIGSDDNASTLPDSCLNRGCSVVPTPTAVGGSTAAMSARGECNLICFLILLLTLSVVSGVASADLVIHNVGDSQSFNNVHRQQFQDDLLANSISHTWVGDVTTVIPSNSYGGASLLDIHNGRVFDRGFGPLLEPGLLQTIPKFDPDVILIFGGINNLIGDSAVETMAQMNSMLDYIESTGDRVVLVSNVPAVVGTFQIRNPEIEAYNNSLRNEILNRRANGNRIALADNFGSIDTATDLNADGVHLNSIGQQKVGNNWFPAYQRATAVPEPSQYFAMGVCLLGMVTWKKLVVVITRFLK